MVGKRDHVTDIRDASREERDFLLVLVDVVHSYPSGREAGLATIGASVIPADSG